MFTSLWSAKDAARTYETGANQDQTSTAQPLVIAPPPVDVIIPTEQAQKLLNYFREYPDDAINKTVEWLIETKKTYGGSDEYLSVTAWTGALFAKYDKEPNERLGHAIIALQAVNTEHDLTGFIDEVERKFKIQAKGDAALKKILEFMANSRTGKQGNAFAVTTYSLGLEYHDNTLSNKWMLFLLNMIGTKSDLFQVALHGTAICAEVNKIYAAQELAAARRREDDLVVETLELDPKDGNKQTVGDQSYRYGFE